MRLHLSLDHWSRWITILSLKKTGNYASGEASFNNYTILPYEEEFS